MDMIFGFEILDENGNQGVIRLDLSKLASVANHRRAGVTQGCCEAVGGRAETWSRELVPALDG